MVSRKLVRSLVIANLALLIAAVAAGLVGEFFLPEALQQYLEQEAEAELTPLQVALVIAGVGLLLALIVSSIGLVLFRRRARDWFLAANVLMLLVTLFFGPYVSTGLSSSLDNASAIATGAVLALIYWSPAREFFEPQSNAA